MPESGESGAGWLQVQVEVKVNVKERSLVDVIACSPRRVQRVTEAQTERKRG